MWSLEFVSVGVVALTSRLRYDPRSLRKNLQEHEIFTKNLDLKRLLTGGECPTLAKRRDDRKVKRLERLVVVRRKPDTFS